MTSAFQAMYDLLQSDRRYKFEAYNFVRESLNVAQEKFQAERLARAGESNELETGESSQRETSDVESDEGESPSNHITGQQLCEACRLHALDQYGYLAPTVLAKWGIHSTGDFGEIVYNLIRIEQMRKSDDDRREDFDDVYPFESAFSPPFQLPKMDD